MNQREQQVYDRVRKALSALPQQRAQQLVQSLLDELNGDRRDLEQDQAESLTALCGTWQFDKGEREEIESAIEQAREGEDPWPSTSSIPTT